MMKVEDGTSLLVFAVDIVGIKKTKGFTPVGKARSKVTEAVVALP